MPVDDVLFKDEIYQIVGCAMEVPNPFGHGFYEKAYENSLVVEFQLRGIPNFQPPKYDLIDRTVKVHEYIPDLICFAANIVDAKTIESITVHSVLKLH